MVSLEPKHYHFSVESLLLDLVFVSKLCWQGISLLLNRASCQPAIVVSVSVMTLRALPHMILSPRPLRAPQAVNLKSFISFHRIRFLCCRKYPSKPKFGCEIESELHQQPRFGRLTHSLGEPFVLLTEVTEHCLNFCFFGFSSAPNVIDKVIKMWVGEKLINVSATLFYQSKSFQFLLPNIDLQLGARYLNVHFFFFFFFRSICNGGAVPFSDVSWPTNHSARAGVSSNQAAAVGQICNETVNICCQWNGQHLTIKKPPVSPEIDSITVIDQSIVPFWYS